MHMQLVKYKCEINHINVMINGNSKLIGLCIIYFEIMNYHFFVVVNNLGCYTKSHTVPFLNCFIDIFCQSVKRV